MEPYFSNGDVTLYNADARAMLDVLPRFDCVLTDPPYTQPWTVQQVVERLSTHMREGWLAILQPGRKRVNTVQLPHRSFITVTLPREARQFFRAGMNHLDLVVAWHFPEPTDDVNPPMGAVDIEEERPKTSHPNPRPIWLMRALVAAFSSPGDTILDPFSGSGTTLLAAAELGRKSVGIEMDEARAEDAARRLS